MIDMRRIRLIAAGLVSLALSGLALSLPFVLPAAFAPAWRVSGRSSRTVEAMFLANMLVMPHEGRADPFLPTARLSGLRP